MMGQVELVLSEDLARLLAYLLHFLMFHLVGICLCLIAIGVSFHRNR